MASNLGLIGFGSSSTWDFKGISDKLKAAEQGSRLSLPKKQLSTAQNQQKDITTLVTLLNTFKASVKNSIEQTTVGKQTIKTNGESASLSLVDGAKLDDFTIDVKKLATKDAFQSKAVKSDSQSLFSDIKIKNKDNEEQVFKEGSFKIMIGKEEFNIKVNSNDTMQSLKEKLNEATSTNSKKLSSLINVKVLDVGNNSSSLMITSKKTGLDNAISFDIVSDENNEDAAKFSNAILEKLGFLENKKVNDLKKDLQTNKDNLENINQQLANNAYDVKSWISSLEKEISLDDGTKINKDSKLSSLSTEQLDKLFDKFKSETSKNQEEDVKNWLDALKSGFTKVEITYKDGEENKTIDLSKISEEDLAKEEVKKAINDKFNELQKSSFNTQAKIDSLDDSIKNNVDVNHVQYAQDALFIYDGVEVSRSSNEIDDISVGATINLKKEGKTDFRMVNDNSSLLEALKDFADNYNTIINNMSTLTSYDEETKEAGALQGISEVTNLKNQLSALITDVDSKTNLSLSNLGFTVNRSGILEFDESVFKKAYTANEDTIKNFLMGEDVYQKNTVLSQEISLKPDLSDGDLIINGKSIVFSDDFKKRLEDKEKPVEQKEYLEELVKSINDAKIEGVNASLIEKDNKFYLSIASNGKTDFTISGDSSKLANLGLKEEKFISSKTTNIGVFEKIKNSLDLLIGNDGTFTTLEKDYKDKIDKLNKEIEKTTKDIDTKFETLNNRFSQYDAMMAKLSLQENQIKQIIEQSNKKS
ncbi:flagellar filament capping protein FliD [Campylobacter canadensis]|uniref:flagellar filament capping protein FliD n=1 Tax=Campylobacter canadensis TaxID=449520 RepID=UPI0015543928|nr:flagellar filament capping protein FliD [Campylobacter canadensis]MBZ7994679.1 flagellar filament capping protein FliD [Campylobacter canadensis]MBZ7996175.1 flagellar filament capping protein FliD [Campylobacter canadensis]MBZ8000009.1 flagellar filament capping protein FliD [Campylobacter canadensis]MBZ8001606.1 flagellar filament capping protein FliD [Campylobacter canadensis]MBZ8003300.1 flagellar filament capping protein FliD [Campylobacter canadensis]